MQEPWLLLADRVASHVKAALVEDAQPPHGGARLTLRRVDELKRAPMQALKALPEVSAARALDGAKRARQARDAIPNEVARQGHGPVPERGDREEALKGFEHGAARWDVPWRVRAA